MTAHHSMTNPRYQPEEPGRIQQERARDLLNELGYEQAVAACRAHGWKGTLVELTRIAEERSLITAGN